MDKIDLWQIIKALWPLWLIMVVLALIRIFFEGSKKKIDFGYRLKERVLNASEQAFYINLERNLGGDFIILSKVRIEDFVEAKEKDWSSRGRIKSRHIDFLICDKFSSKPLLAIEIDGASHKNFNRIERDKFVDELYKNVGLRVEHIRVGSNFESEAVRIKGVLSNSRE